MAVFYGLYSYRAYNGAIKYSKLLQWKDLPFQLSFEHFMTSFYDLFKNVG